MEEQGNFTSELYTNEIQYETVDGKILKGKEYYDYLEEKRKNPFISEKLNVGDKIKIANSEAIYTIVEVDFNDFDYACINENEDANNYYLIEQMDITEIVSRESSQEIKR